MNSMNAVQQDKKGHGAASSTRKRSLLTSFWLPMAGSAMDFFAVLVASILAFYIRFFGPVYEVFHSYWVPSAFEYLSFGGLLGLTYVVVGWSSRHYVTESAVPLDREIARIIRGSILSMGLVMAGIFFYREFSYSRLVFLLTVALMVPLLIFARAIYQRMRRSLFKRGVGVQRIAVWGTGTEAARLWENLQHQQSRGFELVGALGPSPVAAGPSLGDVHMLRNLWQEHELDAVMLAPSPDEESLISDVARAAEGTPVELLFVPLGAEMMQSRVMVTEIGGRPVLKLRALTMAGPGYVVKRLMDFVFSALFLIAFSWLYGIIAVAVLLDSGKPLFYKQRRVGMDGNEFDMIKFRSMRTDAEAKTGAVWAVRGDTRVTRVGRFLRRWSLDEIPQFWSVLRGDMSLVGPRPERPEFVYKFAENIPNYLDRHRVKSGLTGWAVVNGFRGSDTTIEERTAYDLYYVENWSLWLDIRILLRTLAAVISGKGAM
ncbi:MAG: sugar transferase [Calditrichaeota bacterium]|nr:sugar transferase [Calditrichota bacterium]